MSATEAERLAAVREHLDRMKDIELFLKHSFTRGNTDHTRLLMGKYYRLEAEQLLAEEEDRASQAPAVEHPLPGR